jgi:hypothetical protein
MTAPVAPAFDTDTADKLWQTVEQAFKSGNGLEIRRILDWAEQTTAPEASPALRAILTFGQRPLSARNRQRLKSPEWQTYRSRAARILSSYCDYETFTALATAVLRDDAAAESAAKSLRGRAQTSSASTAAAALSDVIASRSHWPHHGTLVALDTLGYLKMQEGARGAAAVLKSSGAMRKKWSKRPALVISYSALLLLLLGSLSTMIRGTFQLTNGTLFALLIVVVGSVSAALFSSLTRFDQHMADERFALATRLLGQLADPASISDLLSVDSEIDSEHRLTLEMLALVPCLNALTLDYQDGFTPDVERQLSRILCSPGCSPEVAAAILRALHLLGTGQSVTAVQGYLKRYRPRSEAFTVFDLPSMAEEALAVLIERRQAENAPGELLRSASNSAEDGATLLRAGSDSFPAAESLLRPTPGTSTEDSTQITLSSQSRTNE